MILVGGFEITKFLISNKQDKRNLCDNNVIIYTLNSILDNSE